MRHEMAVSERHRLAHAQQKAAEQARVRQRTLSLGDREYGD